MMQGYSPQGPDPMSLLMQARAQQKQEANLGQDLFSSMAPFMLRGLNPASFRGILGGGQANPANVNALLSGLGGPAPAWAMTGVPQG